MKLKGVEDDVLSYGLFDGDRDASVVILSNKMLVVRKAHDCVICRHTIPSGQRVRAQTEVCRDDQKVMTFYVCVPCCEAIAARHDDAGISLVSRYQLNTTLPQVGT
jgi:hypothetical protein